MWQVKKFDHTQERDSKTKIALLVFGYCHAADEIFQNEHFIPNVLIKVIMRFYPTEGEIYCLKAPGTYFTNITIDSFHVYLKEAPMKDFDSFESREEAGAKIKQILTEQGCDITEIKRDGCGNSSDPLFTVTIDNQKTKGTSFFLSDAGFQTIRGFLDGYFKVNIIPASVSKNAVWNYIKGQGIWERYHNELKPISDISPTF